MNTEELMAAFKAIEEQKGIPVETIIASIERALKNAYMRRNDREENVEVKFDPENGVLDVRQIKTVVPDDGPVDELSEIYLKDALEINKGYEVNDEIKFDVTPSDFGRLAAQTAKQVLTQNLREAEREAVREKFADFEDEIITGKVDRIDQRFLWVILPGGQEAAMNERDQIRGEKFEVGDQIKVLVNRVADSGSRGPQVFVSRTAPDFIKRLFEQEVPEVYDGTVEIMSIAREPGDRSKVAVRTTDSNLDPIGAMVGPRGSRVQAVVNELNGENMDIVEWVEDQAQYIANALNPSEVVDVIFDSENDKKATVIVPDSQLSLAIGKRGQNSRLAARLTEFKIDIKSESEAEELIGTGSLVIPEPTEDYQEEIVEIVEEQDDVEIKSSVPLPETNFEDEDVEFADASAFLEALKEDIPNETIAASDRGDVVEEEKEADNES